MADSPTPPPSKGEPPGSPGTVKKTPNIKTPREILLEKKVSALEDDLAGLKAWRDDTNTLLADLLPSSKSLPKGTPAPAKGFLDELNDALGLED